MRNIWAIVVGVVLVGGIGVSVSKLFGNDEPRRPAPQARKVGQTDSAGAVAETSGVPRPDASFSEVTINDGDFVLGRPDAPVTIVEYASLTCPHCARFHTDTLPGLKKEFIDTGKVRLVFRDFPLDRFALMAAMVARCAGRDSYFGFIDTFFANQPSWAHTSNPTAAIGRLARLGGMSRADFDACLKNKQIGDAVLNSRLEGKQSFNVSSTPTLIINGSMYGGGMPLDQLRKVIESMLKKS